MGVLDWVLEEALDWVLEEALDWVLEEALDCHYLFSDCFGLLSPVDTQRHIALSF
jgi:hypothetical protein